MTRVALSEWQRALQDADDLTATEHHVALAVAAHMRDEIGDEANCWPSADALAAETNRRRRTVYEALAGLESKGLIHRERRPGAMSIIWATVNPIQETNT